MKKLGQNDIKKAQEFWIFFSDEHKNFFDEKGAHNAELFDSMKQKLDEMHEALSFEFCIPEKGPRQLTLSANGLPEAFPYVELIHEHKPNLDGWVVHQFKQPVPDLEDFEMVFNGDIHIKLSEVLFDLLDTEEGLVVIFFVPGFEEDNEAYEELGYAILDVCLGEHMAATRIAACEVYGLDEIEEGEEEMLNVCALKELVDVMFEDEEDEDGDGLE